MDMIHRSTIDETELVPAGASCDREQITDRVVSMHAVGAMQSVAPFRP
jgi:hypothetical protein